LGLAPVMTRSTWSLYDGRKKDVRGSGSVYMHPVTATLVQEMTPTERLIYEIQEC
jgi:hypothetical protein